MFTFIAATLLQASSLFYTPETYTADEEVALISQVLVQGEKSLNPDEAKKLAVYIVAKTSDIKTVDGGLGGWGHDVVKYLTSDGGLGGWGHDYFIVHPEQTQQVAEIILDGGLGGWGHD